MNILYIVLYVYRMTEHTKCSIGVHYELDKGIESEKKIVCIVLHGLSLRIVTSILFWSTAHVFAHVTLSRHFGCLLELPLSQNVHLPEEKWTIYQEKSVPEEHKSTHK